MWVISHRHLFILYGNMMTMQLSSHTHQKHIESVPWKTVPPE